MAITITEIQTTPTLLEVNWTLILGSIVVVFLMIVRRSASRLLSRFVMSKIKPKHTEPDIEEIERRLAHDQEEADRKVEERKKSSE